MAHSPDRASPRAWFAVAALGVGSFSIVTAELAPIGLLSPIASDLGVTTATAGLAVTLYAWIAVLAALASAVWLGATPRRPMLVGLMLILGGSGICAGIADSFSWLMASRVLGALAHGAFWAMIGTLGAQLVPARQVGVATSIIFGGVSVASVLGVPLANFIGLESGWRAAFLAIGVLSVVVALALRLTIPNVAGSGRVGFRALGEILVTPSFQRIFVATLFAITAHFMAFTYIEPFLSDEIGMASRWIAPLLLLFGLAGLAANVVTGALVDTRLKTVVTMALLFACISLVSLALLGSTAGLVGVLVALVLWGGAVAAVLVGFQTWVLKQAGTDALQASAIYVALFNGAIGLGAAIGSILLPHTGLTGMFLIAAVLVAAALLATLTLREPDAVPAQ
ncbi:MULTISPECIES: MFS transporter [unclassified Pannonibacter]|uniref:MFS transporter n=1 Tax=unclassified Pannonibacter TaxID=2627228 RepID=UPI0016487D93|nr:MULTISPECIES: MFS transporter [unclassified Pannonibacter]